MAMSVPRPNLNQDETGSHGGSFRQRPGRQHGVHAVDAEVADNDGQDGGIPASRTQYPILPTDNGWDSSWDNSTYLFLQKSDAVLKNAFSLETARYLVYQSAITRFDNDARLSASTSTVEQEALRMMPGAAAATTGSSPRSRASPRTSSSSAA